MVAITALPNRIKTSKTEILALKEIFARRLVFDELENSLIADLSFDAPGIDSVVYCFKFSLQFTLSNQESEQSITEKNSLNSNKISNWSNSMNETDDSLWFKDFQIRRFKEFAGLNEEDLEKLICELSNTYGQSSNNSSLAFFQFVLDVRRIVSSKYRLFTSKSIEEIRRQQMEEEKRQQRIYEGAIVTVERFVAWKKKFDEQMEVTGVSNITFAANNNQSQFKNGINKSQLNGGSKSTTGKQFFIRELYGE